jgi:hypothetical protein
MNLSSWSWSGWEIQRKIVISGSVLESEINVVNISFADP